MVNLRLQLGFFPNSTVISGMGQRGRVHTPDFLSSFAIKGSLSDFRFSNVGNLRSGATFFGHLCLDKISFHFCDFVGVARAT